ncbi:MAG: hypothetical protein A4E52_01572 [Pelotomaculum sp. PtaB.Bin013]|nr:MAG: hypothetical protein A4E52_01572 [Pelotomaculum sp. PtaB.Bin013]
MQINGAWNISQLPMHYVVELEDGTLKAFFIDPFREISEADLLEYNGHHPRKCKGHPMPDYLYRFYGFEKNDEGLTDVVRARVTPTEKAKYLAYVKSIDRTESEDIREYVRSKIK